MRHVYQIVDHTNEKLVVEIEVSKPLVVDQQETGEVEIMVGKDTMVIRPPQINQPVRVDHITFKE